MVKSIQIYKYKLCPSKAELRLKLGKGQKIKRDVRNKNTIDETMTLTTTISKVYETDVGIGANIKHEVQIKQPHGEQDYVVWDPPYHVFIVPEHKIMILYGARDHRTSVENTLEEFLSDDPESGFESIFIPHAKMDQLIAKIQTEHIRNYIKKPRLEFDRLTDYAKMEKDVMKMHEGNCASKNPAFNRAKKYATSWDCIMGIFKLNGIVDNELQTDTNFDITKWTTFTSSIDIEIKDWNRFVLETCKGIVF